MWAGTLPQIVCKLAKANKFCAHWEGGGEEKGGGAAPLQKCINFQAHHPQTNPQKGFGYRFKAQFTVALQPFFAAS